MPTYTLNITVSGQDRGALRVVQGVSGALSHLGGVANLIGSIFGAGLLLRGFDALSMALANVTRQAIEAAGNFQMLQLQMQGLLAIQAGTEDMAAAMTAAEGPARDLLDWIADFAVKTPFTVQTLSEMVRDFLALGMGTEPTKRLTNALASLGGGLGLTEWQLQRVIWNLTQTTRSMKITERDVREFGNAGLPVNMVLDAMAKKLGVTRLEALEFAKSGEAGVAAWTEALIDVAERYFPDALDNISKTWNVAKSNIKDVIESVFGKEVLGPVLGRFGELVAGGLERILGRRQDYRRLGEQLGTVFDFLAPRVGDLTASVGNLVAEFLKLFGIDLSNVTLSQFIAGLALAAGDLLENGTAVVDWLATLPGKIKSGLAGNETVAGFLADVNTALGNLGTWWDESGEGFVGGLGKIGLGLAGIATSAAEPVLAALGNLLASASATLAEHGPEINAFLDKLGTFLQENKDPLAAFVSGLAVVLVVAKLLGGAAAGVTALGAALAGLFSPVVVLAAAVGVLLGLLVKLSDRFVPPDIADKLNWWQKAVGTLAGLAQVAWQLVVIVGGPLAAALWGFGEWVDRMIKDLPKLIEQFRQKYGQMRDFTGVWDRLTQLVRGFLSAINDVKVGLASLVIPWWIIGHSPSPLENWLKGVAGAMAQVADAAPRAFGQGGLGMQMRPAYAFAGAGVPAAALPVVVNIHDPIVRREEDLDRLTRMVIEGIRRELR